jgi:subtilisin family serine protease
MRLIYTLTILLFSLSVFGQTPNGHITERLRQKMEAEPNAYHSVSILLNDRVDVGTYFQQFQKERLGQQERFDMLVPVLQQKAKQTHAPLIEWLQQSPDVQTETIHSYWITNLLFVSMRSAGIEELSSWEIIDYIDLNVPLQQTAVEDEAPAFVEPDGVEPGLLAINAPALWDMGYTGYGTVSFTNDTGVDPSHPAISTNFRGFYTEGQAAWYDYESENVDPFDCGDHGTHVTGTIMGLDRHTNDTIGVAFNSQWIGAAILCGIGTEDNVAAFEWSLNPDEDFDTTDDVPDVINNSWRDPGLEGECTSLYVPVLEAMETLGIAVIFSAGNEGPEDETVTPPHNININLLNSFTVGALNGNNPSYLIANFSSRGPSICGGTGSLLIKPEVSAPGVQVRSCVPGDGYGLKSGTSMSAPHVAGAALLLKEAFPDLLGYEIKEALYFSAVDLGDPGEDNTFGMGIIDVLAAYNYLIDQGHMPVNPNVTNDLLLIDVETLPIYCAGAASAVIFLENAGSEVVTSFEIAYSVNGETYTTEWTGQLFPGERTEYQLPDIELPTGLFALDVELKDPNGNPDEKPLNNRFIQEVNVNEKDPIEAYIATEVEGAVCESGQALLRVGYLEDPNVQYTWYDAPDGGDVVAEGPVFLTDPLTETTTYYVEGVYPASTGLGENTDGMIGGLADAESLIFDCHHPFVLKSVRVNAEETGMRIIKLRDGDGEFLEQEVVNIQTTGWSDIELGFDVPVGEGLQLELELGKGLYYNEEPLTVDFPYAVPGVLSITGSNRPDSLPEAYFYFYDWEIEYKEVCGRSGVTVEVSDPGDLPVADFEASSNLVWATANGTKVDFVDQSENANSWFWDFGDGVNSNEQNPSHEFPIPQEDRSFIVSLTVKNEAGCLDADTMAIFVQLATDVNEAPMVESLEVFPNPVRDELQLQWPAALIGQEADLTITDLNGRLMHQQTINGSTGIPVGFLASGMYYVQIEQAGQRWAAKFVVTGK